jgi:hypothetical protein
VKFSEARQQALAKGATDDDIERYARNLKPGVPTNNMIRALQMHSWNNTSDDWARLAGALKCRSSSFQSRATSPKRRSSRS